MRWRPWIGLAFVFALVTVTVVGQTTQPKDKEKDKESEMPPTDVGGKSLEQWIKAFSDYDISTRDQAIRSVVMFGKDARKAVHGLIGQLSSPDVGVRANAASALGTLAPVIVEDDKLLDDTVRALVGRLAPVETQVYVRYQCATALGRFGPKAKDAKAINTLASSTLRDPNSWEIRKAAAFALGRLAFDPKNGPDENTVKHLTGALKDTAHQVRLEVVTSMIILGPPAQPQAAQATTKSLETLIKTEPNPLVSLWSRIAIMRMNKNLVTPTNITAISKFQKHTDPGIRCQAAQALAMLTSEAKSTVLPLIMDGLKDKDLNVVLFTVGVLGNLGENAKVAVPELQKLAKDSKEDDIKEAAAMAIEAIMPKLKPKPEAKPKTEK